MIALKPVLCGSLLVALAACSSPSTPPHATAAASKPASASTAVPASNPFSTLIKDRDKARAVQQVVNKRAQAEQKAMKKALKQ